MVVSLTTAALLPAAGIVIGIMAVIITSTVSVGYNNTEATFGKINDNVTKNITVTVNIGGEPQQSPVQSGKGSLVMTTYLPVNMTQTINLQEPTENMILYPIFERWDGVVRTEDLQSSTVDENNNTVPRTGGIGVATILRSVVATCTEPYFVNVTNAAGFENGGIQFENTTAPVPSEIAWGGPSIAVFTEPQSGTLYYMTAGYGIVPADYNDDYDSKFFENTGAGNQDINGTYHLNFVSFYPATINLPEQADMTSFLEVTCTINSESPHVPKSEFPNIYVYDVWFRTE